MSGTMNRNNAFAAWLICSVAALSPALSHEHEQSSDLVDLGLGAAHFVNSGAPPAQPDFLRGVLLLHSFEYPSARVAFQHAERLDPNFAMAYWGEALTYNQPLWGQQDLESARSALAKLGATPGERAARARTEREREYLEAVELLYGEGDKSQRDAAFSAALGGLARRHPDDLDARAFYALSILGLTNGVRNVGNYMRAAAEGEAVFERDRRHPGALHYLIHAYDDPVHAPLGLRAANLYGAVAPAAPHALHMPSHIFFALGMWDPAIAANIASLRVAREHHESGYHSLVWLAYAYLQKNDRDKAWQLIQSVAHDVQTAPNRDNRLRLAHLQAIWRVETGGTQAFDASAPIDAEGITSIGYFNANDFAVGISSGANESARRAALARLRARTGAATVAVHAVAVDWHDTVTAHELAEGAIMSSALEGVISYYAGGRTAGISQIRSAIAEAQRVDFEYGPPWSVKPLDELAGELLLADGRRTEAAEEFEKALALYPNRRLALQGLQASRDSK